MRWWRFAIGGALLLWVVATAYRQARARHREMGCAVLLAGAAVVAFVASAFAPRPPVTIELSMLLLAASIAALAGALALVLWKGFRR